MNKKLFASAMFAVAAFFTNAALAVGYDNSNGAAGYAQGANAQVAAGGGSVRANDLIVTAESSGVSADIPSGSKIIVRLPEGLNFDGEPTFMVTTGSANGLTLLDAIGDPTRDDPAITMSDANGDGGMDRAEVVVGKSGEVGDKLTISSNITALSGTKAKADVKALVVVNQGLANSQSLVDIVDKLSVPVASNSQVNAQSIGQENVTLLTPTIVLTIPAGSVGSKTITLTPASGITWASATTTISSMTTLSPVASAPIEVVPGLNVGNASATNSITLRTTGSTTVGTKFATQVAIKLSAVNVSAGTTGLRGVTVGGGLGIAGQANIINVVANGSDAMLSSTTDVPGNKVVDMVAGSTAEQTLPAITVTENFNCDAVGGTGCAGTVGTQTLTFTAGTGLMFGSTASITVSDGTIGTKTVSAQKNKLTLEFATRSASSTKIVIGGIMATASATASGDLSVTVGGSTDKSTAPKKAVVVAKAKTLGTVDVTLGDKKKATTGPGGTAVTSTITLSESTYGAISTANDTQVEDAFFKITPQGGATIIAVTVTAKDYPSSNATAPTFAACEKENITTSYAWICKVNSESTALASGTSTVSVAINYSANAKSTTPGAPPAAVVGTTIDMAISGNAGVEGTVSVADVIISTTLTRGQVPDLTPGNTEAQKLAPLTINEEFVGSTTSGKQFRLIAPAGATFNNTDAFVATVSPVGAIVTPPTITATFEPQDTLLITLAARSTTVTFTPSAVIGPKASGWLTFTIADGDITGANVAGVTGATIALGYADGTLDKLDATEADVTVVTGFKTSSAITGGLAIDTGYTATSGDTSIATAKVSGSTVSITGVAAGTTKVTVKDELGASDTIDVEVTAAPATSSITIDNVVRGDGTVSAAKLSGAVSADGGQTFGTEFTAGDNATVSLTIDVDPDDEGQNGGLVVAVRAIINGTNTFAYLNEEGTFSAWDLTPAGLGIAEAEEPLGDVHNISFDTGALQAGTYKIYFGYKVGENGIVYTGKAIKLTVSP